MKLASIVVLSTSTAIAGHGIESIANGSMDYTVILLVDSRNHERCPRNICLDNSS
jgi:hypothetical protein